MRDRGPVLKTKDNEVTCTQGAPSRNNDGFAPHLYIYPTQTLPAAPTKPYEGKIFPYRNHWKGKKHTPSAALNIFVKEVSRMPKKPEIRTASFVHIGDELVNTDDLDDEQRRRLATWLKTTYLNALFKGKAEFYESSEQAVKESGG